MTAPLGPTIASDVWQLVFQYLDFRGQACCTRVCRLWNKFLHELQYEYGRFQALRALNQVPALNLQIPLTGHFYAHGVRESYVLLSSLQNGLPSNLWFLDIQAKKSQEIRTDPECGMLNLRAARWVSNDKFATIQSSSTDQLFDITLWKITKKEEIYQIDSIAQEQLPITGRFSAENVLPLENRLFIKVILEGYFYRRLFSLLRWPNYESLRIDFQNSEVRIQKIKDQSNILYGSNASNSKMLFALDHPGRSAFRVKDTGQIKLAWKVENIHFSYDSMASDQWFVATTVRRISIPPETLITSEEVTFHVFEALTGREAFVFTQTYTQCYKFCKMPFWLNGNFLTVLVGKELLIFHIPTRSHLTSINASEVLSNDQLIFSLDCPIYIVQVDQEAVRIVYEEDGGIQVRVLKLENQHGKLFLPAPQVLSVPAMFPPKLKKWDMFKGFLHSMITLPLRLFHWIGSFFTR